MGPRLFRRGNFVEPLVHDAATVGFNGATPFQTWKYVRPSVGPRPGLASMGPRLFRRGNFTAGLVLGEGLGASMGPRLFRRGNSMQMMGLCDTGDSGFNGATPFQTWKFLGLWRLRSGRHRLQWGHAFSDVEIPRRSRSRRSVLHGFNGATPFQTWKSLSPTEAPSPPAKLQWGHAFSDVEMYLSQITTPPSSKLQWGHAFSDVEIQLGATIQRPTASASMGPRLFRRGNTLNINNPFVIRCCFNGATPFQTWKLPSRYRIVPDFEASMGPRLFRRGNGQCCGHNSSHKGRSLQWGHAFSDVEISFRHDLIISPNYLASMGPRLFRRGNSSWRLCLCGGYEASMGPRLFRRGNLFRFALR